MSLPIAFCHNSTLLVTHTSFMEDFGKIVYHLFIKEGKSDGLNESSNHFFS